MRLPDYSAEAVHAAAAHQFQECRQFLWHFCYRMTGTAADADDLVQETFARAIARPPLDMREGWRLWLTRVAASLSIDALRLRTRRPYLGLWLPDPIETGDDASPPACERVNGHASTANGYDLTESVSVPFLLALERLTPRQRAVLILRDVFDCTTPETAKALDLTQATVKATHHRARQAMEPYEEVRLLPTRERQAHTAERLHEFMGRLMNQDAPGIEALLARDARAAIDGGGEFHAPQIPVVGRRRVARVAIDLAMGAASAGEVSFRMLNGMPALVAKAPAAPGRAPRFVFQIHLDAGGAIAEVHAVLASRKLTAVRSGA